MNTFSPIVPGRSVAKIRHLDKCERCRSKKIKCTPFPRDFELGQRCDECVKTNQPCSANTRVPRKSVQTPSNASVATPSNILSPPELSTDPFAADATQFGMQSLHIRSPSQSIDTVVSPSQSNDLFSSPQRWFEADSFNRAQQQIRLMGSLTELYEYCHHRNTALRRMRDALSLLDIHKLATSLDLLMDGISLLTRYTLKDVRLIIQTSMLMSPAEKQLLSRRTLDTGHRLSRCGNELGKESSFDEELTDIRSELIDLYRSQGDHAEVHRLRATSTEPCQYLQNFDLEALQLLSKELVVAMHIAFKDLKTAHRKVLDPKGRLKISSSHLALLSDRVYGSIEPHSIGRDMEVDITGRNVLHLAAERNDTVYLQWWLNSVQKDKTMCRSELNSNRAIPHTNVEKVGLSLDSVSLACLETADSFGLTPLMVAAYEGRLEAFRLLADAGANLKAQHASGKSILSLAAMAGNETIVTEILSRGINIQDSIGFCSPIHDAAATGRSEKVIRILLEHNAEPRDERMEYGGKCASTIAIERKHSQIAKVLQEAENVKEAKQPTKDPHGQTLRNLKRIIDREMARSNSPEPPLLHSISAGVPSIECVRGNKRQKNLNQEWYHSSTPSSLASSSPRRNVTVPAAPGTHGPMTVSTYSVRTVYDLEAEEFTTPMTEYIIDPEIDYTFMGS